MKAEFEAVLRQISGKSSLAQALRYRYLAAKARREANTVSGDPIAPRLIELAEKLEGDAARDEEEARILLAEQDEATPFRRHD